VRLGVRTKEYLQCAKRAGLWLAFVFSPSEIDQWQNRPRPVSCSRGSVALCRAVDGDVSQLQNEEESGSHE